MDNIELKSLDSTDVFKLIDVTRKGVDFKTFDDFTVNYPLNVADWSRMLSISERSIQRYKREKKRFDSIHTEKILLIMLLFNKGTEVFGSTTNFLTWIDSKSIALGGVKPINLLDNFFGIKMVQDELVRIEHGVLA